MTIYVVFLISSYWYEVIQHKNAKMKENTENGPNPGIDPCPLSSQSGTLLTFAYDLSICLGTETYISDIFYLL